MIALLLHRARPVHNRRADFMETTMPEDKKILPRFYEILIPGEDYSYIVGLKPETEARLHRVIRAFIIECVARLKKGKSF